MQYCDNAHQRGGYNAADAWKRKEHLHVGDSLRFLVNAEFIKQAFSAGLRP